MTDAHTMWSSTDSLHLSVCLSVSLSVDMCVGFCSYIRIHTDSWDMRCCSFVPAKERGSVTMTMALETNLTSNHLCILVSSCFVFFFLSSSRLCASEFEIFPLVPKPEKYGLLWCNECRTIDIFAGRKTRDG